MPLHLIAKGALIGGAVGLGLAALRRPAEGEADPGASRYLKSAAEGALAGVAVGFALDRRVRLRAAALLVEAAPVVLDSVGRLAERYSPEVERFAGVARERALEAYGAARPKVEELADAARHLEDALAQAAEAFDAALTRASELRPAS